jgi:hypothetical protein
VARVARARMVVRVFMGSSCGEWVDRCGRVPPSLPSDHSGFDAFFPAGPARLAGERKKPERRVPLGLSNWTVADREGLITPS